MRIKTRHFPYRQEPNRQYVPLWAIGLSTLRDRTLLHIWTPNGFRIWTLIGIRFGKVGSKVWKVML